VSGKLIRLNTLPLKPWTKNNRQPNNLKVLTIIPARAGSKRLPSKNWRPLAGRPLADYVLAATAAAKLPTDVVVNSDSEEVLALGHGYANFHCLLRPAALSTDRSPAIDYVTHTLAYMESLGKPAYDAVAIIQPTSPFTLAADIDATIALLANSGADTAVSITEIPHDLNPLKLKVLRDERLAPYFEEETGRMAAHDLPQVYIRNGAVYVTTLETIRKGQIIGLDCRGYLMPRERSVDINDDFDWRLAEFLLQ
jgi:CMP-N,N'-diacetyllegionaminic acid synthase